MAHGEVITIGRRRRGDESLILIVGCRRRGNESLILIAVHALHFIAETPCLVSHNSSGASRKRCLHSLRRPLPFEAQTRYPVSYAEGRKIQTPFRVPAAAVNLLPSSPMEKAATAIEIASPPMLIPSTANDFHSTLNEIRSALNEIRSTTKEIRATAMENRSTLNEIRSTAKEIRSKTGQIEAFSLLRMWGPGSRGWTPYVVPYLFDRRGRGHEAGLLTSSPTRLIVGAGVTRVDSLRRPLRFRRTSGRQLAFAGVRRARDIIDFPEQRPEIPGQRMQPGIAGHNRAAVGPPFGFRDQFRPDRVGQNVETHPGEGVAFSFLVPQHVVVGLRLKSARQQQRLQMRAQK